MQLLAYQARIDGEKAKKKELARKRAEGEVSWSLDYPFHHNPDDDDHDGADNDGDADADHDGADNVVQGW